MNDINNNLFLRQAQIKKQAQVNNEQKEKEKENTAEKEVKEQQTSANEAQSFTDRSSDLLAAQNYIAMQRRTTIKKKDKQAPKPNTEVNELDTAAAAQTQRNTRATAKKVKSAAKAAPKAAAAPAAEQTPTTQAAAAPSVNQQPENETAHPYDMPQNQSTENSNGGNTSQDITGGASLSDLSGSIYNTPATQESPQAQPQNSASSIESQTVIDKLKGLISDGLVTIKDTAGKIYDNVKEFVLDLGSNMFINVEKQGNSYTIVAGYRFGDSNKPNYVDSPQEALENWGSLVEGINDGATSNITTLGDLLALIDDPVKPTPDPVIPTDPNSTQVADPNKIGDDEGDQDDQDDEDDTQPKETQEEENTNPYRPDGFEEEFSPNETNDNPQVNNEEQINYDIDHSNDSPETHGDPEEYEHTNDPSVNPQEDPAETHDETNNGDDNGETEENDDNENDHWDPGYDENGDETTDDPIYDPEKPDLGDDSADEIHDETNNGDDEGDENGIYPPEDIPENTNEEEEEETTEIEKDPTEVDLDGRDDSMYPVEDPNEIVWKDSDGSFGTADGRIFNKYGQDISMFDPLPSNNENGDEGTTPNQPDPVPGSNIGPIVSPNDPIAEPNPITVGPVGGSPLPGEVVILDPKPGDENTTPVEVGDNPKPGDDEGTTPDPDNQEDHPFDGDDDPTLIGIDDPYINPQEDTTGVGDNPNSGDDDGENSDLNRSAVDSIKDSISNIRSQMEDYLRRHGINDESDLRPWDPAYKNYQTFKAQLNALKEHYENSNLGKEWEQAEKELTGTNDAARQDSSVNHSEGQDTPSSSANEQRANQAAQGSMSFSAAAPASNSQNTNNEATTESFSAASPNAYRPNPNVTYIGGNVDPNIYPEFQEWQAGHPNAPVTYQQWVSEIKDNEEAQEYWDNLYDPDYSIAYNTTNGSGNSELLDNATIIGSNGETISINDLDPGDRDFFMIHGELPQNSGMFQQQTADISMIEYSRPDDSQDTTKTTLAMGEEGGTGTPDTSGPALPNNPTTCAMGEEGGTGMPDTSGPALPPGRSINDPYYDFFAGESLPSGSSINGADFFSGESLPSGFSVNYAEEYDYEGEDEPENENYDEEEEFDDIDPEH